MWGAYAGEYRNRYGVDPVRNARNALKVMIKYLMLDIEQCRVDALMHHFDDAIVLRQCAQWLDKSLHEALAWGMEELIRQGELRREGELLLNA